MSNTGQQTSATTGEQASAARAEADWIERFRGDANFVFAKKRSRTGNKVGRPTDRRKAQRKVNHLSCVEQDMNEKYATSTGNEGLQPWALRSTILYCIPAAFLTNEETLKDYKVAVHAMTDVLEW